jgi:hypothetical protein
MENRPHWPGSIIDIPAVVIYKTASGIRNGITIGAWGILSKLSDDLVIYFFVKPETFTFELLNQGHVIDRLCLNVTNNKKAVQYFGYTSYRDRKEDKLERAVRLGYIQKGGFVVTNSSRNYYSTRKNIKQLPLEDMNKYFMILAKVTGFFYTPSLDDKILINQWPEDKWKIMKEENGN